MYTASQLVKRAMSVSFDGKLVANMQLGLKGEPPLINIAATVPQINDFFLKKKGKVTTTTKMVNVAVTSLSTGCKNITIKCFLPIPLLSTNPLALLLSNPTPFINSADKALLGVCMRLVKPLFHVSWRRPYARSVVLLVQLQTQIDKATSSQLVTDIGDLSKQFGVDMKDVMSALRTTSSFIGTFRTGLLQELSQRSMFSSSFISSCVYSRVLTLHWPVRAVKSSPNGPSVASLVAEGINFVLGGSVKGIPDLLLNDVKVIVRNKYVRLR